MKNNQTKYRIRLCIVDFEKQLRSNYNRFKHKSQLHSFAQRYMFQRGIQNELTTEKFLELVLNYAKNMRPNQPFHFKSQ